MQRFMKRSDGLTCSAGSRLKTRSSPLPVEKGGEIDRKWPSPRRKSGGKFAIEVQVVLPE
jgi:hypothetical protein